MRHGKGMRSPSGKYASTGETEDTAISFIVVSPVLRSPWAMNDADNRARRAPFPDSRA